MSAEYYDPHANWDLVPEYMRGGIIRYVMSGIPPGGFLTAVFANDLMEAVGKADNVNQRNLVNYARFLYNYVPSNCKGSYETVDAWVKSGGINGQQSNPHD